MDHGIVCIRHKLAVALLMLARLVHHLLQAIVFLSKCPGSKAMHRQIRIRVGQLRLVLQIIYMHVVTSNRVHHRNRMSINLDLFNAMLAVS